MAKIRVAALQFAAGVDIEENLQTCLRMIDRAAEHQPKIMVLPEFCNHASWYREQEHAFEVAIDLHGWFTEAIAAKAREHGCYIMLNATVRREKPCITGTNILFNPVGEIIAVSDKQVLMGNENNFLSKADSVCPIIETEFGKLAMYSCMDGVIFETPRGLAVRGAQILLNSLNSFADDEVSLHVPVRAAENKVFVVAANKVGSLVPEELAAVIAERVKIAPEQLHGAGESQIVAPDGTVLAKAPKTGEAVIFADIDPEEALNKLRPDGTNIMQSRKPELYAPIAEAPKMREYKAGASEIKVATYNPKLRGQEAIKEVRDLIPDLKDVAILVLPALCFEGGKNEIQELDPITTFSQALRQQNSNMLICTSVSVRDSQGLLSHLGILIGRDGTPLMQKQVHPSNRPKWVTDFASQIQTLDTPFGRIAIVVGSDSIYPELFRVLALQNVEIVLNPNHVQELWEVETGLIERAAENRMNIVMASRSKIGSSLILALDEDFTLWTEWKKRPFDGNINYPIVHRAKENLHIASIYPACAGNRMISQKTDVVDGRPWWLVEALIT